MQEEIKEAIFKILKNISPDAKIYKDGTVEKYPSFYVSIINTFINNEALIESQIYKKDFYIRIEYRASENPNEMIGFNTHMDNIGSKLLDGFRIIRIKGENYYPDITNNEVIDFVRIFEFNFSAYVRYEQEEYEKMREITLKGGLK